jgi:hypothetical protein
LKLKVFALLCDVVIAVQTTRSFVAGQSVKNAGLSSDCNVGVRTLWI